jgi:hypothetical protein
MESVEDASLIDLVNLVIQKDHFVLMEGAKKIAQEVANAEICSQQEYFVTMVIAVGDAELIANVENGTVTDQFVETVSV